MTWHAQQDSPCTGPKGLKPISVIIGYKIGPCERRHIDIAKINIRRRSTWSWPEDLDEHNRNQGR